MQKATSEIDNSLPSSFLHPQNLLFLDIPDSELVDYLQEAHQLVYREPIILAKLESDLDSYALGKKRMRLLDKEWELSQSRPLPNMQRRPVEINADELRLQGGRNRMSPYLVYMFLLLRGFWSGVKCNDFKLLLSESKTIQLFLDNYNEGRMPGFSTISENINKVSNETLEFIFDAQIRMISDAGLDDFEELTIDSTSVSGNSAWPTDSDILTRLVKRTFHRGRELHKFGIANIASRRFPNIIKTMTEFSRQINFTSRKPGGKAKRQKWYRKLLKEACRAHKAFQSELKKINKSLQGVNLPPSQFMKLARLVKWLEDDVNSISKVLGYCSRRINENEATPSKDKVLSLSDESVGFIKKGDREPVIGYKPQIGRSKRGFIPVIKVPEGNAADSGEFLNIVEAGIARICRIPNNVSVDDGYANKKTRNTLLGYGVKVVSISGAKGKKIIGEEDWESEEYIKTRNNRSAVESLMFTIKHGFNFGKVMRRGLKNVRAELLEKVLAYNFCRMTVVRKWPKEFVA